MTSGVGNGSESEGLRKRVKTRPRVVPQTQTLHDAQGRVNQNIEPAGGLRTEEPQVSKQLTGPKRKPKAGRKKDVRKAITDSEKTAAQEVSDDRARHLVEPAHAKKRRIPEKQQSAHRGGQR